MTGGGDTMIRMLSEYTRLKTGSVTVILNRVVSIGVAMTPAAAGLSTMFAGSHLKTGMTKTGP